MDNLVETLFVLAVFITWIFIAWKVGLAAKNKDRRRFLWTVLSVFPLGPIYAPLWLATLPHFEEKATRGQLVGRTFLIALFSLVILGNVYNSAVVDVTRQKAKDEFGLETRDVTSHYKK